MGPDFILTFGQWVKYRRKSLDMTQEQLAHQVGCSAAAIKKIESNERRPSRQIAGLLAEQLRILPEQQAVFVQVARGETSLERLPAPGMELPAPRHWPAPLAKPHLNIPAPAAALIGRERELETITRLLLDPACRLVTLTGVGGAGKTRLAVEAAIHLQAGFAEGACFVSLAGVDTPDLIIPAIASAMEINFSGPGDVRMQLFQSLRNSRILLVLDNLEHLLAGAELFGELLQHVPGVKLLVTSREPLHLQAEWVFEVRGLPVPQELQSESFESSSAANLFLQRARQAHSGFSLDAGNSAAVGRICQLVQGLPLAIELAANWTRALSCEEIVQEIERGLEFLSTNRLDMPPRHRSMWTVFDHSWKLLNAHEQRILKRMAVFRGGIRREAAEFLTGAGLTALSVLIDKSLLWRSTTNRYEIHELVRQYLASRLAEDAQEERETRRQHSRYYLTLLKTSEPVLRSRRQKDALAELDADIDNIRLAWNTAVEHEDIELLSVSGGPLYYYYELNQYFQEGEALFQRAADLVRLRLAALPAEGSAKEQAHLERTLASLLNFQAFFNLRPGNNQEALQLFHSSLALLRPQQATQTAPQAVVFPLAFALVHAGVVYWALGDFERAAGYLEEGLSHAAALEQTWLHGLALGFLGGVSHDQGNSLQACRLLAEAVKICQAEGDPEMIAFMGIYYSRTLLALNRLAEARLLLMDGLKNVQETGNRWLMALGMEYLARIARTEGDDREASRLLEESIQLHRAVGDRWSLSLALIELSRFLLKAGETQAAEQHTLEALQIVTAAGYTPIALEGFAILAAISAQQGLVGEAVLLIQHILQHPATKSDTRAQAQELRDAIAASTAADHLQTLENEALSASIEAWIQARYGLSQPMRSAENDLL
jgi:predicted ATPase/transcriptional regulator with XRE-family HTH domain